MTVRPREVSGLQRVDPSDFIAEPIRNEYSSV